MFKTSRFVAQILMNTAENIRGILIMARLQPYNKDILIIATVAISALLILGLFVMPFSGAVPTPQPAYTYGGDDKGDGGSTEFLL